MLTAIFSQFGMSIINGVLDRFLDAFKAYENKQISIEELRTRLYEAMLGVVKEIEVAHADALAKIYQAFMGALAQSPLMQRVWATAVLSQLFVLVYHQFGIPLIVLIIRAAYEPRWQYPSSGNDGRVGLFAARRVDGYGADGAARGPRRRIACRSA